MTSQREIRSDWLVRPRTVTFFSLASAIMLIAGALVLALYLSDTKTISLLETSTAFRTFCGVVGVVAAPSGIYLLVGMLWYWAKLDTSTTLQKTLWFLLFLLTGFFALAFYSIVVYRRQATNQQQIVTG
ncbi:MAG TPA: hypothetical protein VN943_15075 [Candidatus Acidoferrum sp.]|nr:hypothetical protein [Candidatus Acidoferrum sp.]